MSVIAAEWLLSSAFDLGQRCVKFSILTLAKESHCGAIGKVFCHAQVRR